jgi:glucose/arabinose dehydrogenase
MLPLFLTLLMTTGLECSFPFETWRSDRDTTIITFVDCLNAGPLGSCPQAEAGANQNVGPGTVVLSGAGSVGVGKEMPTYSWLQVDNGAPMVSIQNADQETASFVASELGSYVFELTVTSGCRTATDQTVISVEDLVVFPQEVELTFLVDVDTTVVEVVNANDDRLFIVGKDGLIRIWQDGQLLSTPFLDISNVVVDSGEQGLLGLAFDPDYATNGFFYVNYVGRDLDGSGQSRVTRIAAFEVSADPNVADAASGNVLLSIDQPASNHNGGQIIFGPDGFLYIGLGDGGGANDTFGHGQNTTTLLATILRIEVNGPDTPYQIPASNPFASGMPGFREEIWAYGLRNPWRMSFDSLTGELYIADVGQNAWEELNVQPAGSNGGENYGWPLKEGTNCFEPSSNCDPGGLTDPIFEYSHSLGCSVTGGYVYRGQSFPGLGGFYIMTDYCTANFWLLKRDGQNVWQSDIIPFALDGSPFNGNVSGFGQDNLGELYICTQGGEVYQITGVVP